MDVWIAACMHICIQIWMSNSDESIDAQRDTLIGRLDQQPSLWIAVEETGSLWHPDNFRLNHIRPSGIFLGPDLIIKPKTTRRSSLMVP